MAVNSQDQRASLLSGGRPFSPYLPEGAVNTAGHRAQLVYLFNNASERRLRISWAEFSVPSVIPRRPEGTFIGAQPGQRDPRLRHGDGLKTGPHGDFYGEQPGYGDPTIEGLLKKRPPLGETTDLDNLPG